MNYVYEYFALMVHQ